MARSIATDLSWITVAEWLCRTSDRHIVLRVPGSSAHLRRGAPAANSFRLCGLLQSSAHALGITERCALASSRPTIWRHCRNSDPGWAASPIRPDMIFGKDRRADCRLAKWHFGRVFRVAASGGPRPRTCEKGTGDSPRRRQGDGLPANLGINPRNQPANVSSRAAHRLPPAKRSRGCVTYVCGAVALRADY